jgi:hypothetical protein
MRKTQIGVISLFAVLLVIASTVYADTGVKAMPEIQGLSTGTGMNVQGTITETDSGAWSMNANGIPISGNDPLLASYPGWGQNDAPTYAQWLEAWNNDNSPGAPWYGEHLQDVLTQIIASPYADDLLTWLQSQGSPLTPPLQDGEVQYTTGYNDQMMAVSGQSVYTKSMALSTGNKIADQSNIKADTSIQYIAIDTGRATRTEDLLLDGVARSQDSADLILCPFANANPGIIPAFCNIEQAGSAFDTTLTSTVTSADTRLVGTDATIPVVLNYNINAGGITLSDGSSSPMIGSVSAYLKVHVQEARNESVIPIISSAGEFIQANTANPLKAEDLVYSETSAASGLINKFSKSMSYSSQASAVLFSTPETGTIMEP